MHPNLFLIAAPRSGSTQLARWLDTHKDITLTPVKEPNFFSAHEFDPDAVAANHLNDIDPETFVAGPMTRPTQFAVFREKSQYLALFSKMTTPWRMEASTSYLACPEAPALIKDVAPDARLIFLTRDPVARALSHYRLAIRTGRCSDSLKTVLKRERSGQTPLSERFLLRPSEQAQGIDRFKAHFAPEQCLFLTFEEMIKAPEVTLQRIAAWLALPKAGFDLSQNARNAGVPPRFPTLNRVLQNNGLKTRLRRTLPRAVKTRLKPLWFDAAREIKVPPQDYLALAEALRPPPPHTFEKDFVQ